MQFGGDRHRIGGEETGGASTRTAPVWDPATGERAGRGACWPSPPTSTPRSPRRASAFAEWSEASLSRRAKVMFAFRELLERQRRGAGADRLLRARQGARGRQGRGAARPRGGRVRLRDPAAAEGRVLRPGLDHRRRVLLPPAARRLRRDHPVQLPGDGADVDAPGRDRLRQHLRPEALRARPLRLEPGRRALRRGGAAGRRLQRRPRRQGRGRRAARPPRRRRRSPSSARPRSPPTSTPARPRSASGCRRSAGRRTTRW